MDGQNAHKPGSSLFSGIFKDEPPAGEADKADERAEGGKERALNSARNMLARGYEVSEIAEVTELTPEEINALQQ